MDELLKPEYVALGTIGFFVVMWVISIELRLKSAENKLIVSEQENIDHGIKDRIKAMSRTDVNRDLTEELGPPDKPSA
jgi:hypothetical protein